VQHAAKSADIAVMHQHDPVVLSRDALSLLLANCFARHSTPSMSHSDQVLLMLRLRLVKALHLNSPCARSWAIALLDVACVSCPYLYLHVGSLGNYSPVRETPWTLRTFLKLTFIVH
jgi:hypothetical protein